MNYNVSNKVRLILIVAVLLITVGIYLPSLKNGFVNWDDNQNVYQNDYIKAINHDNLKVYFTKPLIGMYTPLVYISFAVDYQIAQLDPFYYHLTNLLLHVLNVLLIWLIILALTNRVEIALVCALLFAIHPMNVGGVAPVSVRGSLLYSFFYLLAYLSYLLYLIKRKWLFLLLALVFFSLSLLSKSAAVVLPLLMLATDFYLKRRDYLRMILEKIPLLGISLIFGIITIYFRADAGHLWNSYDFTVIQRFFLVSHTILFYLFKLILPLNLSAYYPYPEMSSGSLPWDYYAAPVLILILMLMILKSGSYKRHLIFGSAIFFIQIGLVLKIIPLGDEIACDRYAYLPFIGIYFMIGLFISRLIEKRGKIVIVFTLAVLSVWMIWLGILSENRIKVWNNSIVLYNDVLSKYPKVAIVYYDRGIAKLEKADVDGALSDFSKAISINPYLDDAWIYRGNIRAARKDFQAALSDLNKAIQLKPGKALAYVNRGSVLYLMNYPGGACSDWQKALKLGNRQAATMIDYYCR
jgi:tetratricopeptide (TPR) repeat protein